MSFYLSFVVGGIIKKHVIDCWDIEMIGVILTFIKCACALHSDIMASIADVKIEAPVKIGDVILADAAGTGVNIVATKDVARG